MLLKLISMLLATLLLPRIIVGQSQSLPTTSATGRALASGGQQALADETNVPASEMPPDEKAFREANRIIDPAKRIEALQKFKREFPKHPRAETVEMGILAMLARTMPGQTSRIQKQADLVYRTAGKDAKGRTAGTIASTLLNAGVLLKEAERYAQRSVNSLNEKRYIKEQLASARARKVEPPKREELVKRFRESRAAPVATLGRIEVALGNDKRGKQLLEEARKELPANAAVAGALGELAAKQGETAVAMDYLLTAHLGGRVAPSTIAALESVYRQTHNGSLDGLESMLNQEYRRRFPNPLKLEDYTPTEKRSSRVVLGEIFTGSGCPPCVAADLAFDAAMERYDRKELAVLAYHVHIPRPDPMTNPATLGRYAAYDGFYTPTYAIDGTIKTGGGARERTKETYDGAKGFNQDIEKDLELPAEASINLATSISQGVVKASAAVDKVVSESRNLQLHIALVEKEVVYGGENGIRFHSMVVRAMGGPKEEGFPLDSRQPASFEEVFDIARVSAALKAHLDDYEAKGHRSETFKFVEKKHQIDPAHLAVVAFVQDAKTKRVLQAAYMDVPVSGQTPVVEPR